MILLALLTLGRVSSRRWNRILPCRRACSRADECLLAINGHDIREYSDADAALRLNVNDVVQIDALSV